MSEDIAAWTAVRSIQFMNEAGQQRDRYRLAWLSARRRAADEANFGMEALELKNAELERLRANRATIQELRALQQPLVDGLRFIHEDMDRAHKSGDEWATGWLGDVWLDLPLHVRAAGGDTDAAQELADKAQHPDLRESTHAPRLEYMGTDEDGDVYRLKSP
ncbi:MULTISPECIES: hypothetical protein [unclassified Streptomyces]|uniref:hypothetical protein n=1 Tax=unclassified Streptomyces TaxID=2593676 RepID=UPI00036D5C0E|nr:MULTISPECIES: hypothetical protein [unclassified Streptomyces]MYY03085.1 hypothetical protein [Streptomyces sp. SID4913]